MPEIAPRLDLGNECVWRDGVRHDLPPKAFLVLRHLAANAGRLVTKEELLDAVWPRTHVTDAVLSVAMAQVRDALGDEPRRPRWIETVHRRGYRLLQPLDAAAPAEPAEASPVVGRDDALAEMEAAWERARAGQRQLVLLTGEAGIGKTTLVERFVAARRRDPGRGWLAEGQCVEPFGGSEAYLPVLDALGRLARSHGDVVAEVLRRRAPTWLVQLPWLLTDADRRQLAGELGGTTRERMLREVAEAVEALAADRPLALVFEDLHWCDPSTIACLAMLAQRREPARLLLLGTYRPVDAIVTGHPVSALRQKLRAQRQCVDVALMPLAPGDVRALLEARFPGLDADALATLVWQRTNGNPLFVVGVLEQLLERGQLVREGDVWRVAPEAAEVVAEVPDGLRELVERQIAQLPADWVATLEAASVTGAEPSATAVAAALGAPALETEAMLSALGQRGDFLRPAGEEPVSDEGTSARFTFVHALRQQVLYQRVPAGRRAELHARLGAWLETRGAGPGALAHHLGRAGRAPELRRAVVYAERAAEAARAVCAFEEAVAHYQTTLALADRLGEIDPACRAALLVAMGETQQAGGMIAQAERTLERAVAVARQVRAGEPLARAALCLGQAYERLGRTDTPLIELCHEALDALGPEDGRLRAELLAHLLYVLGPIPGTRAERERLGDEAVAMARRLGDADTLAHVLHYARWASHGPQTAAARRAAVAEIEALLPRVRDRHRFLTLHLVLIAELLELAEHEATSGALARLAALVEETPIPWFRWFLLRLETVRALHEGALADAERLMGETLAAGQLTDHPNVVPLYGAQSVLLAVLRGRLADAEPVLDAAVTANPRLLAWQCVVAWLRVELGRPEGAAAFARLAAEDFTMVPQDTVWSIAMAFLAMAGARLGDARAARALYALMRPHGERCPGIGASVFGMGHASRYLALLAATFGDAGAAQEHFERALVENAALRARPWLAMTQVDLAEWLLRRRVDEARAVALSREAEATAAALGMERVAAQAARLVRAATRPA